jgi:hypothetical protein
MSDNNEIRANYITNGYVLLYKYGITDKKPRDFSDVDTENGTELDGNRPSGISIWGKKGTKVNVEYDGTVVGTADRKEQRTLSSIKGDNLIIIGTATNNEINVNGNHNLVITSTDPKKTASMEDDRVTMEGKDNKVVLNNGAVLTPKDPNKNVFLDVNDNDISEPKVCFRNPEAYSNFNVGKEGFYIENLNKNTDKIKKDFLGKLYEPVMKILKTLRSSDSAIYDKNL